MQILWRPCGCVTHIHAHDAARVLEAGCPNHRKHSVGSIAEEIPESGIADDRWQQSLIIKAAQAAHEANRFLCIALGDTSQAPWDHAAQWKRDSAIKGVQCVVDNPNITPEQQHQAWLDSKTADGWVYGPDKDPVAKEHPCIVPYNALPHGEQIKDYLFGAVVRAVLGIRIESDHPLPVLDNPLELLHGKAADPVEEVPEIPFQDASDEVAKEEVTEEAEEAEESEPERKTSAQQTPIPKSFRRRPR